MASAGGTGRLGDKAVEEDAVDPILPHPLAVQQRRPFAEAAVEPGRRAVGHFQTWNLTQIPRVVIRNVGPHVDLEPSAAAGPIEPLPPVPEPEIRPVAGGVEPPLITAENLAVERRGVNIGARWPVVGTKPWLVRFRSRLREAHAAGVPHQEGQKKDDPNPAKSSRQGLLFDLGHTPVPVIPGTNSPAATRERTIHLALITG